MYYLIRRYLSGPDHRFESGGEPPSTLVSMRMGALCVDGQVVDCTDKRGT